MLIGEARTLGSPSPTCCSQILPQLHDPAHDSLLLRQGEVCIPPVERMKHRVPADVLELPQECPLWAAILTLNHDIITGRTGKDQD